jgi:hypothetical protein
MFGANRALILHRHQYCLQIDQNEIPHDPHDLGVRSDASKTISKAVVCSAETVHLSCVKISTISNELTQASTWASSPRSTIVCVQNDFRAYCMVSTIHAPILHRHQHYLQMDQNEILHDPCHLGVPSGASKAISKNLVRSSQTMHLSCVKISTISNELNQASTWALSPRSTIGCIENDFWAYVCLAQTVHLSWTDTNTISKWTKTRFHMTCLGLPSGASKMVS